MRSAFIGSAMAVMLGLGSAAGDAHACPDKTIQVFNAGRVTIVSVYAESSSRSGGYYDWLGDGVLQPGQSFTIDLDDGMRDRTYDFKAVFENGREVTRMRVDVCSESEWNVR